MKRSLLLTALVVFLAQGSARADWPKASPYLGVFGGWNQVTRDWDLGQHLADGVKPKSSMTAGLRLGFQVLRNLGVEINGSWVPSSPTGGGSKQNIIGLDAAVLLHLTRGKWAPFVEGGAGGYIVRGGALGSDEDPIVHVGVGLRGLLARWLALRIEARDMMTDGKDSLGAHNMELTGGLDFFWPSSEKKATKPILVPEVVVEAPPPDRDHDGVVDKDDKCPDVAGKPELAGCPDKDGDGVTDAEDKCPDVAGKPELQGCPDKDGDGVTDAEDKCPDVAGKPELQGCPDRDNDGVADADDKCPDAPGLKEFQGCLPPEVQKFTGTIQGITFKTGSDKILKPSFKVLDAAIKVFMQYLPLRVRIEGHTDNVGKPEANLALSQARADSVKNYLIGKGIVAERIEAVGYGDTKPKADNKKPKGRAQNRRIEFTILGNEATPPAPVPPPAPAPAPTPPAPTPTP